MGTSQILMIVLGIIVVGVAVAIGIQMFVTTANNNIRQALISDIMQMAVQGQAWFRTPEVAGGSPPTGVTSENLLRLVNYIDRNADGLLIENVHGTYVFTGEGRVITITATSTSNPSIVITGTVDLVGRGINTGIVIE